MIKLAQSCHQYPPGKCCQSGNSNKPLKLHNLMKYVPLPSDKIALLTTNPSSIWPIEIRTALLLPKGKKNKTKIVTMFPSNSKNTRNCSPKKVGKTLKVQQREFNLAGCLLRANLPLIDTTLSKTRLWSNIFILKKRVCPEKTALKERKARKGSQDQVLRKSKLGQISG